MILCDKNKCTGCLACYNVCKAGAISVYKDKEGFIHPHIEEEKCLNCGLCEKSCPILAEPNRNRLGSVEAYAAWSKDYSLVRKSSSGGVFSVISTEILKRGGSVYGAAFDDKFQVHHIRVDNIKELTRLRGSKYVQSFIGKTYQDAKEDLKLGRWVLYSGTPCQIAGLIKYLGKEYERLITLDLVCHGVPTPLMFDEFKNYLERKYNSNIVEYSFRDKKWSWFHFNQMCRFENGKKYYGKWEESFFFRGFLRDYYTRICCHDCQFAKPQRQGDITIADFWCYRRAKGEEKNRDRGVNAVIVNTQKGKDIFEILKKQLYVYKKSIEEIIETNDSLVRPYPVSPLREEYWEDYENSGYDFLIDKYFYPDHIKKDVNILYTYGKNVYRVCIFINFIMKKLKNILFHG